MAKDLIELHCERAAAELDLAMRAENSAVAKAHFSLSALHVQRVERLLAPAEVMHPVTA